MRKTDRVRGLGALILTVVLAVGGGTAAQASTMKECSAKYKAAKKAGTLNGQDWKAFRASQCGSGSADSAAVAKTDDPSATATVPTATASPAPAAASTPPTKARTSTEPATVGAGTGPVGNATFPNAVNSKYSSLKPGKAREKTCLDQYHANKSSGANGGLKWIQKGGGYYSQCLKRLKAA